MIALLAQQTFGPHMGDVGGDVGSTATRLREVIDQVGPLAGVVAAALVILVLPSVLRAWRPGSSPAAFTDSLGRVCTAPSRLLARLTTGDVRMHVAWMTVGAVLLVGLLLAAPAPARHGPFGGPDDPAWRNENARPAAAADHVDIRATWPHLALVAAGVLGLVAKTVLRRRAFVPTLVVTAAGIVAAGAIVLSLSGGGTWHDLMGLMVLDPYGVAAMVVVLFAAAVTLVAGLPRIALMADRRADFLLTAVLSLTGTAVAVVSTDFLTLFTGLALMFVCNVILLGMQPRDPLGTEATVKVLITSLTASGLMLFGMALLYGATGDTQYDGVAEGLRHALAAGGQSAGLARVGLALLAAGAAYLLGAAPMHLHAADLHGGAPPAATGFVTVMPVLTGLLVTVRLWHSALGPAADVLRQPLLVLGAVSAVVGALAAWAQSDRRRVLGHVGAAVAGLVLAVLAERMMCFETEGLVAVTLPVVLATCLLTAILSVRLADDAADETAAPLPATLLARSLASGLALALALVMVYAALAVFLRGNAVAEDRGHHVILLIVGLSLVVAAGRLLVMFGRLASTGKHVLSSRTRFATAGLFLLALAAALAPLAFTEQIGRALQATWPR